MITNDFQLRLLGNDVLEIEAQERVASGASISAAEQSLTDDRIDRQALAARTRDRRLTRIRRYRLNINRRLFAQRTGNRLEGRVAAIADVIETTRRIASVGHLA